MKSINNMLNVVESVENLGQAIRQTSYLLCVLLRESTCRSHSDHIPASLFRNSRQKMTESLHKLWILNYFCKLFPCLCPCVMPAMIFVMFFLFCVCIVLLKMCLTFVCFWQMVLSASVTITGLGLNLILWIW